jgi:hypothetical protein
VLGVELVVKAGSAGDILAWLQNLCETSLLDSVKVMEASLVQVEVTA